jgi:hypothetical protein
MKRIQFVFLAISIITIMVLISFSPAKVQSQKKILLITNSFPADVNVVLRKCCIQCHDSGENENSKVMWNYSKWTTYSAEIQSQHAKSMCNYMSSQRMPPNSARNTDPKIIPTSEDIDIICKWSNLYK